MDIAELLAFSVKNKASDLHLSAGLPPMIRVDGDVRRINIPSLDHKQVHSLVYDIMSDKQRRDYEEFLEVDFSFEIAGMARFRVNAFNQNRGAGAVFRTIPSEVLTLEDLACPPVFRDIINQPQGLILCTGPTGSGKSTTLAAMVDHINQTKSRHIVTIEDPIEYLHRDKRSVINQREVGFDTASFKRAMRRVLRQDPDVILIGEMRDEETVQTTLSAAETRITSGSWRRTRRRARLKDAVSIPTSRWLMAERLSVCTNSIGSSIVTMWSRRVRFARSSSEARVVVLPEPVGPVTRTSPRGRVAKVAICSGMPSS